MGRKYIIELEDENYHQYSDSEPSDYLWKVKGFNALVFDEVGISKLTPYTEPDLEQVRKEGYEKGYENGFVAGHLKAEKSGQKFYEDGYRRGLADAWEAARKIVLDEWDDGIKYDDFYELFNEKSCKEVLKTYTASEVIEKIQQYEQAQKESEELKKDQSVTAEEVMRQYLDIFCKNKWCSVCPLNTPDFTCGRGYYFLGSSRISDEEVRRAYAEVLQKMREN